MSQLSPMSESDWVLLVRNDSSAAFQHLFEKYSQKLYRFSYSYLRSESDAEEIVQEVFLKVWENRHNLKCDKSFHSYLFTIAFNAIKKRFIHRQRAEKHKHALLEWFSQEKPSIESRKDFEYLVEKLELLINQLPEKRKQVFLKRKKEGKSIAMIAIEMGISPKTVKNQITEAMNFLKKSFCEQDDVSALLFYYLFLSNPSLPPNLTEINPKKIFKKH